MLIDSHCHLDFPDFSEDLDQVLARAKEAGIARQVTICTHVTRFPNVLALAEAHDSLWCTVGIHPHEAGREPPVEAEELVAMADHDKVIGFGETGLDYFYEHSPREDQKTRFRAHIKAARTAGLPLVVHTRDAESDTVDILCEEMGKGTFTGVIHCFSGSSDLARACLDLGFYISLSGIVTFKKAEELRETVRQLPPDRVLVETDAPYLAPVPRRGKRCEPAFTTHTAEVVAQCLEMPFPEFAAQSTRNFYQLFRKAAIDAD